MPTHCASVERGSARPARWKMHFLPIQRLMIGILGHQHLRQQSRRGQAFVDDLGRHRRLDQRLALRAGPFAADVALDLEHSGNVVELLADVLADALQRAAATAHGLLRLMAHVDARQIGRQRSALRLFLRFPRWSLRTQRVELGRDRFQIGVDRFFEQAALDATHLLAARGKLPALEHRHLMRQLVDLELLVLDLLVLAGQGRDQIGGEVAQLLRVHPLQLIAYFHALDAATASATTTAAARVLRDANARLCADATPRQAEQQRLQLFVGDRHVRIGLGRRPDEATLMQTTRAQPDADAVVHEHLDPIRASIARTDTRDGHALRRRPGPRASARCQCQRACPAVAPRAIPRRCGSRSTSFSHAVHSAAAVTGHSTLIVVAPRRSSMVIGCAARRAIDRQRNEWRLHLSTVPASHSPSRSARPRAVVLLEHPSPQQIRVQLMLERYRRH